MHALLTEHSLYYAQLSAGEQDRFRSRVAHFVVEKDWRSREDFELTEAHKVRIAAVAIELTFGLNEFLLPHFNTIVVYPKEFTPPEREGARHGEVHPGGAVVLSWKAFQFGMGIDDDGKNVGLHEFAHTLNVSDLMGKEVDKHFSNYFPKWYMITRFLLTNQSDQLTWLLKGRTVPNQEEMFAVTVEHFFERPQEFARHTPDYFSHTARLLNLDPVKPG